MGGWDQQWTKDCTLLISRDLYIAMFSMTFNQHKVKCDHSALGASGVDRLTQWCSGHLCLGSSEREVWSGRDPGDDWPSLTSELWLHSPVWHRPHSYRLTFISITKLCHNVSQISRVASHPPLPGSHLALHQHHSAWSILIQLHCTLGWPESRSLFLTLSRSC